jgi:hypothetical protein
MNRVTSPHALAPHRALLARARTYHRSRDVI